MYFHRRRIGKCARRRNGRRAVRRYHQHGHRGILRGTVIPVRRRSIAAAVAVPQHRVSAVGRGESEDDRRWVHVGGVATVPPVRIGRRAAGEPDVRYGGRDTGAVTERDHREPEPTIGHRQGIRAQAQLVRPGRRPPAQGAGRCGR